MDLRYLLFLQELRNNGGAFLAAPMMLISNLVLVGAVVLGTAIYWGFNRMLGYEIFANCTAGLFVNHLIKLTACIYRPWIRYPQIVPYPQALDSATGYSFPSAHTQVAVSFYGTCAVKAKKDHKGLCALCVLMVLLTGFSRNYLGVHTLQDVVVSLIIGTVLIWVIGILFKKIEQNPSLLTPVAVSGIVIVILGLLYFHFKSYPMEYIDGELIVDPIKMRADGYMTCGATIGFLVGVLVETRFVRFKTEGTLLRRILRIALGIPFPALLMLVIKPAVYAAIGSEMGHLVVYSILAFYIIAVYPAVFTAVEKRMPH